MTQRRPHPSLRSRVRHLGTRDTWGWIWLDQVAQDLRYGFRLPLKNRSFTLVAVSTLALGIGSIASLYSIFDSTYLHTAPAVTHPVDETVLLAQQSTKQAGTRGRVRYRPCCSPVLDVRPVPRELPDDDGVFSIVARVPHEPAHGPSK